MMHDGRRCAFRGIGVFAAELVVIEANPNGQHDEQDADHVFSVAARFLRACLFRNARSNQIRARYCSNSNRFRRLPRTQAGKRPGKLDLAGLRRSEPETKRRMRAMPRERRRDRVGERRQGDPRASDRASGRRRHAWRHVPHRRRCVRARHLHRAPRSACCQTGCWLGQALISILIHGLTRTGGPARSACVVPLNPDAAWKYH
jgi:hypothetical protein